MAFTLGVGPVAAAKSGSTITLSLVGTTAGRSLVLGLVYLTSATLNSVTCSGESNLTLHGATANATSGVSAQMASLGEIVTGGDKTVTVNFSADPSFAYAFVMEVTGGNVASFFDATAGASGNDATPTVNVTTAAANALVVAIAHSLAGVPTAGGAYVSVTVGTQTVGEYDLDAGVAGVKTVDFSAGANQWVVSSAAFNFDASVRPVAGSLALTGIASTVYTTGGPININPLVGALSIAGVASSLSIEPFIAPSTGTLSLTGVAPVVSSVVANPIMEVITGIGQGYMGGAGTGVLEEISGTGSWVESIAANAAVTLERITGFGTVPAVGASTFEAITGTGQVSITAVGAGVLQAIAPNTFGGEGRLQAITGFGVASLTLANTFVTRVMNTRNNAVTSYSNYNFNSYARIGSKYYGAGTSGLVELDGDDDAGTAINWSLRTGFMDDKTMELKRLPEVVIGLRSNGPVRVRVYPNDSVYYDYMLPSVKTGKIHQHRVKPGKGMRSRYYAIELQGMSGSAVEIDSMQPLFSKTTRRLG